MLQNAEEKPVVLRTTAAASGRHFTQKNASFRAPASSPTQPTQTFKCILQLHVANPNLCMHTAGGHGNNDAAIFL